MIKVAHIVTAYTSVVTILDSKLRALDQYDDIALTAISSPADNEPGSVSVRYIPVFMSRQIQPVKDLNSIWQLYRIFKREGFDIVHSHTAKAGFITAVAARLAGVSLICHTYHGLPFYDGQSKKAYSLYRMLEKLACQCRHHVFTQNRKDMEACIRLIGSNKRVSVEGNGVSIDLVRANAADQLPLALQDYHADAELKLAMLSRLEPVKRVSDLIKAVKILKTTNIRVSAVIAGTGILQDQLQKQIKDSGLSDCIRMVGFTGRPHGLIAAADIVVLCSEKEGIPRAIMEAMALEKPVVATDVLGTQELVQDKITGFLVPLGDVERLADHLILLARNNELRAEMGRKGFERVQRQFDDNKIAEMLHRFYLNYVFKSTKAAD